MKIISKLEPQDLAAVLKIEQQCHRFPWSEQILNSNQGPRYRNFKLALNQQLVGFCIIQTVVDEATLFNLAIAPAYQRQGLATELLNTALNQLMAEGIKTVWLEVRASNLAAIKLYQQLGFNQITIRPDYYPAENQQREDAIIMALSLAL